MRARSEHQRPLPIQQKRQRETISARSGREVERRETVPQEFRKGEVGAVTIHDSGFVSRRFAQGPKIPLITLTRKPLPFDARPQLTERKSSLTPD
jgi:hypothetical protein